MSLVAQQILLAEKDNLCKMFVSNVCVSLCVKLGAFAGKDISNKKKVCVIIVRWIVHMFQISVGTALYFLHMKLSTCSHCEMLICMQSPYMCQGFCFLNANIIDSLLEDLEKSNICVTLD